ncbi:MAG: glycosyltransferase [Deltaproteobacteria bacterium]|nr:glycosyltransferase [Deltaproteobacteria bacterium]
MKILHVIPSMAPRYGGPIHALWAWTHEQAKQGHQVTVMTTNIDGPGVLKVSANTPIPSDGVETWYFSLERPRAWVYSRALGRALSEQVSRFDIAHIHTIFLWPTTAAAYWCNRRGVPCIIRPAGSLDPVCLTKQYESWFTSATSRLKKWTYFKTLGQVELQRVSAMHFTSMAEMDAARPLALKPPAFVMPLGVAIPTDRQHKLPVSSIHARFPGKKIILFLSRLDRIKGLELLIDALAILIRLRTDFAFIIAGDGPEQYKCQLQSSVAAAGLDRHTFFAGHVNGDEKWDLLSSADLFVLPSYHENFGVAVVEAMAAGLPVVISNGINIHGEVAAARAGFVTGFNASEIAQAVHRLLDDGELGRRIGRNGLALAQSRFAWSRVVRELTGIYQQLLVGAHPSKISA